MMEKIANSYQVNSIIIASPLPARAGTEQSSDCANFLQLMRARERDDKRKKKARE